MAKLKLTMNLRNVVAGNQQAMRAAMRAVAPQIKKEILKNTSSRPGGHLHDSGDMRRSLEVVPIGGKNPRIEVRANDYGIYQDQGFQHVNDGFIHNPWITPVIRGQRNDIVRAIALRMKQYNTTGKPTLPRNK